MATRIETLEGGRRVPQATWIVLFAVVVVASALVIGTRIGSDDATPRPVRTTDAATVSAIDPGVQVPGLIKAGLQPRPYSGVNQAEIDEVAAPKIADGSARVPGEVRPKFGG